MKEKYDWVFELTEIYPDYSILFGEAALDIKSGKKLTLDDCIESFSSLEGVDRNIVEKIINKYK